MAVDQAWWHARSGARCEFILLNPPCPHSPKDGRDYVTIDPEAGNAAAQVETLRQVLRSNGPGGTTPLARQLRQLRKRLTVREMPHGRRIMLSIVTDGIPTTPDGKSHDKDGFVTELREFADALDAFIVIRLATDDKETVDFYNRIDAELELPLDILDDLQGEAKEVHDSGNGWFVYTPLIHRVREGGTMEKLFDLLDERPFTTVEIAAFLELLLRGPHDEPFPRTSKLLLSAVERALPRASLVYDESLRKMVPPVDLTRLKVALGSEKLSTSKGVLPILAKALRRKMSWAQMQTTVRDFVSDF